jgi:hypothetical protein
MNLYVRRVRLRQFGWLFYPPFEVILAYSGRVQWFVLFAFLLLTSCHVLGGDAELAWDQPRGLSFGKLKIYPAFNYDLTYTDNARRSGNEEDDFLHEFLPSVSIQARPDEMIDLDAFYEFGWHDYQENESPDYLSHRATGQARIRNVVCENLDLIFGDSYIQSANTSPLQNEFLFFSRYQTNNAYARAQYEFNRFLISGKIEHGLVDYFSRANAGSDYMTYSGEINGEYQFVPTRLTLFGTYSLTRTLRDTTDIDDFDTHKLLVGARGSYSKLTYSVAAGYTLADFLNRDEQDDGPSVLATLTYRPHERLNFSAYASRGFVAGVENGISTETLAGVSASVRLLRRATFLAGYSFADSDRVRGQDIQSSNANATFEYRFTRFAAATAGYSHIERHVSTGTGGYIENAVRFGFRFSW